MKPSVCKIAPPAVLLFQPVVSRSWGPVLASATPAVGLLSRTRQRRAAVGLLAKAAAEGSVLVIASLALPQPFTAEAELSLRGVQQQRAAIAAATDAVLAALDGQQAQVAATFTAIPTLALRVDAKALLTLAACPRWRSIQEDVPVPPSLASSTAWIGLPAVWASGVEGAGQTVVMLDTGIDTDHPFFAPRLVNGACFSNAGGVGGYSHALSQRQPHPDWRGRGRVGQR